MSGPNSSTQRPRPTAIVQLLLVPLIANGAALTLAPGSHRNLDVHAGQTVDVAVRQSAKACATVEIFTLDTPVRVSRIDPDGGEPHPERSPLHGMPHKRFARVCGNGRVRLETGEAGGRLRLGVSDAPAGAAARRAADIEADANRRLAGGDAEAEAIAAEYGRAAALWAEAGDDERRAYALVARAFLAKQAGDKPHAIELFEQARAIPSSLRPWIELNLALYSLDGGERAATDAILARGLDQANAQGDLPALSALESARGLLYHSFGELDAAGEWYRRALARARAADYRHQQAVIANNIAGIHYVRGEPEQAFAWFDRALDAHRRLGDWASAGEVQYNEASLYLRAGEVQAALPLLLAALDASRAHEPGSEQEAYVTARLGSALYYLGNVTQARNFLKRALELHQRHESWSQYARALLTLGALERADGRIEDALRIHEDALSRYRELERHNGEIGALLEIAEDHLAAAAPDAAAAAAAEAVRLAADSGDALLDAQSRLLAGRAAAAAGDAAAAESALYDARRLFSGQRARQGEARADVALGRLRLSQQRYGEALSHARSAQAAVNDLRARIPPADLRATYFASQLAPYDLEVDLLMARYRESGDLQFAAAALAATERASARTLVELTGAGSATAERGSFTLQQQINTKLLAARAFADAGDDEERRRAERDLQTLLLRAEAGRPAATAADAGAADIAALRALLPPGTLLLRYWQTDERLYWWTLDAERLAGGEIADADAVLDAARRLHASLRAPGRLDRRSLRRLSVVTAPLDGRAPRTLYLVADGALALVPFDLLPGFVAATEIAHLPALGFLRHEPGRSLTAAARALAVADPVYGRGDERLAGGAAPGPERAADPYADAREFRRLPSTAAEAEALRRLLGPGRTEVLVGFDASKERLMASTALDADILHFATHGVVNAELPELSSLVLAGVDAAGHPRERYLTLREIYGLPLAARLVVLSACETRVGRRLRGEGVLGLSRGFIAAGADAVVSSLWPVSDKATAELMTRFYHHLLVEEASPAAALAAAKADLRGNPAYRDPYFYAGFVLLGR